MRYSPRALAALVLTSAVGTVAVLSTAAFAFRPTGGRQFLSMVFGLVVLVALACWAIAAVVLRHKRPALTRTGLLISLLGFAGCFAARPAGNALADAQFRHNLSAMHTLVEQVRANGGRRLLPPMPAESLPPFLRSGPRAVATWADSLGRVGVDFHYGGGFPVRHSAYVYYQGTAAELRRNAPFRWRFARALAPDWYDVSD